MERQRISEANRLIACRSSSYSTSTIASAIADMRAANASSSHFTFNVEHAGELFGSQSSSPVNQYIIVF
jgi:hypothetical protein